MKFKTLFQALSLLTLVFGATGQAQAAPVAEAVIVSYDMSAWNATYSGTVSDARYERWAFSLTESTSFVVTAAPTSGDLVPVISLQDLNGNEISTLVGALDASQPAGDYFLLIRPQSGSGSYDLTVRRQDASLSASVVADSANVNVDDSVLVRVKLNNVPPSGLSSAEFSCTYDHALIDVSGISDTGLFGSDAAMVVNGPASGKFIAALAGSNGRKAVTSGDAFVFYASGLQVGQTSIVCTVRVSSGDQILTTIPSTPASINVVVPLGRIDGNVTASKAAQVCVYDSGNVETCAEMGVYGNFGILNLKPGVYKIVATAAGSLKAENTSVTVEGGKTVYMEPVSLLAGDIDGNGVIDQFDAMSIGMNYNAVTPAAANLNNDGVINVLDLELLAANYRKTAPQPNPWKIIE